MLNLGIAKFLGINQFIDSWIVKFREKKQRSFLEKTIRLDIKRVSERKKTKIFVIGFNKTGTTSVLHALLEFDLILGNQKAAEWLLDDIVKKNYEPLFEYCKTAEAFQDIPFSLPEVYQYLDKKYPNSKFILTVRSNADQWFNSISKFHGKLWAGGSTPTKEDLAKAKYVQKGYALRFINQVFGESYYDKDIYTSVYNQHNQNVIQYFKDRPNDLLIVNVEEKESYINFCKFIGQIPVRETFEWKNKT